MMAAPATPSPWHSSACSRSRRGQCGRWDLHRRLCKIFPVSRKSWQRVDDDSQNIMKLKLCCRSASTNSDAESASPVRSANAERASSPRAGMAANNIEKHRRSSGPFIRVVFHSAAFARRLARDRRVEHS